ncbi:unnamed protein product [Scytosiphon promiscuus]
MLFVFPSWFAHRFIGHWEENCGRGKLRAHRSIEVRATEPFDVTGRVQKRVSTDPSPPARDGNSSPASPFDRGFRTAAVAAAAAAAASFPLLLLARAELTILQQQLFSSVQGSSSLVCFYSHRQRSKIALPCSTC